MSKAEITNCMLTPGVIAIMRSKSPSDLPSICESLYAGGICAVEITMTTPGAIASLVSLPERIRENLAVGVGTVLSVGDAREAIDAGAQFLVTPVLRLDVVAFCRSLEVPIVCGAFTPTEAQSAHEAGADFIKIFPADCGGPSYIKSILAPLPHLRIIPTGGVTLETCRSFLDAGCVALGVGSNLVSNEILGGQDWMSLTERAKAFVDAARR